MACRWFFPHHTPILSWFPAAACKVNRLKEGGGGRGLGLGQCKGLVKFNRVSGDSSPLKKIISLLAESSWTHEDMTWIKLQDQVIVETYNSLQCWGLFWRLLAFVCCCCFLYRCRHLWLYITLPGLSTPYVFKYWELIGKGMIDDEISHATWVHLSKKYSWFWLICLNYSGIPEFMRERNSHVNGKITSNNAKNWNFRVGESSLQERANCGDDPGNFQL